MNITKWLSALPQFLILLPTAASCYLLTEKQMKYTPARTAALCLAVLIPYALTASWVHAALISAADKFRGPHGNFSLLLIVVGDPSVDVILAAKKSKAVFPLDDASGLQSVQVLADRYLGDSQFFGQKGHFQPLFLGQQF